MGIGNFSEISRSDLGPAVYLVPLSYAKRRIGPNLFFRQLSWVCQLQKEQQES